LTNDHESPVSRPAGASTRWWLVVLFAVGMAWVEAACVYYLRLLVDRLEPYQSAPLPISGLVEPVELTREAATLLMLLTVGMLAGWTERTRLAYSAIAFGVWDIFYYLFLRLISGWPASLFDWDVLFLLPLPWWGPVLAPMCIASLMIVWGTLASRQGARKAVRASASTSWWWRLNWLGIALALYVFMADALRTLPDGMAATRTMLPTAFNWPLFIAALLFMAAPIAHLAWRMRILSQDAS
jgi:hypothetical protein